MKEQRKLLLDRFTEHLHQQYENYCDRHDFDKTDDNRLITFLIDQDLIPSAHIQRFTVRQEFEQLYPVQDLPKTKVVNNLAHRFSISERTVWSILKGVKGKRIR